MFIKPFFYLLAISAAVAILIPACKSGGDQEDNDAQEEVQTETPAAANVYTVSPFTESTRFADASIDKMSFKNGRFDFAIGGKTYKLGEQTPDAPQKMCANSAEGQHLHIIVGANPYDAKYTSSFDYEIADGEHYVLAFLSRSYHESIKTDKAHRAVKAQVQNNAFVSEEAVEGPMLFYSRPKGTYVGKEQIEKVMLDFYLVNVQLGSDYKVKAEINAEQTIILDEWKPFYIEGLPLGDNKIKLTLIDKDGNPVDAPHNPVERVFTLLEDPLE
jgi:hypothetical protein